MEDDKTPKVFISYSWSSDELVLDLAKRLGAHGVDVVLDKWDLKEGNDKYEFMERCVNDSEITKVLIICDKIYAQKANDRTGGVGDETVIISSEIYGNARQEKFISDTTKYEDHFVAENRLIAISKSGRSMDSEDVQNFLNATERGIDVQLFVRKNKDDKISKEFYYLGRVIATGNAKQFVMPNTDKTAVEIEWELETPVREDIYQYIVNE